MQAMKSCAVLILIMTIRVATSSWHLYLFALSHDVVKRYQYASTGEQVKMRTMIKVMPYAATENGQIDGCQCWLKGKGREIPNTMLAHTAINSGKFKPDAVMRR